MHFYLHHKRPLDASNTYKYVGKSIHNTAISRDIVGSDVLRWHNSTNSTWDQSMLLKLRSQAVRARGRPGISYQAQAKLARAAICASGAGAHPTVRPAYTHHSMTVVCM